MFQTSESCIKLHAVVVLELLLSEQCPLLQVCVCVCVCALGWVKCREQNFTAGYILYNYVCDKKNKNKKRYLFIPITDYGKMLKYRSTDISVDL